MKCFQKKYHGIKFLFIASGVALAIIGGWLGKRMMKNHRALEAEQDINQGT
jgi:hypothetical protein